MKRAFFALLAVTLAFAACEPAKNENVNRNTNANGNANQNIAPTTVTDKPVYIYIYDDLTKPGYYLIDDPGSVILHTKKKQKIRWCIFYDGSTPPSEVVIDNFRTTSPPQSPTATNPFGDGTPGDNTFTVPSADFNCKHLTKTAKTDVVLGGYKYMITAKVGSADRGHLDPVVIIDN